MQQREAVLKLAAVCLGWAFATHACGENAPSSMRVVCAIEAPICARANANTNVTVVSRSHAGTRSQETLWSVPTWLRVARVTEAGETVLAETSQFNAVPHRVSRDFVVLQLWTEGVLSREIRLGDVLPTEADLSAVRKAGAWARHLGSERSNIARYLLVNGRTLLIDLTTKQLEVQ